VVVVSVAVKPLGKKSYGSIGHLPGSRLGPGDHHVNEGQAHRMLAELPKKDRLIVTEKVDGSNVGVCKVDGRLIAINRAGWDCWSSPHEQHRLFAAWVAENYDRFDAVLGERERICGEWLALAHGTLYTLTHEPFVAFDVFDSSENRLPFVRFMERVQTGRLVTPHVFHDAPVACAIEEVAGMPSQHGAAGGIKEGVVYRWERGDRVLMLAKWVRPDKVDGHLLVGNAAAGMHAYTETWNWRPGAAA
jgi:ATP-dependent RNA circularization protein (DNA/RNA ligase family)